jgi:signal transduction histidine kinase
MSPHERDSLLKITRQGDTINVDEARKAGIGKTSEEIIRQLGQDRALLEGFPVDLYALDSLFFDSLERRNLPYMIWLYDRNKTAVDSVGVLKSDKPAYQSGLLPVGVRGLQYIQLKTDIPRSDFIKHQLLILALSAGMIGVVLLCLLYQLTGIRKRDSLLLKRETSVNGIIHDLKSPLNSAITLLGWIQSTEQDARRKERMDESLANLKRLVGHIESLLMTARKGKQTIVLNKSAVNLPQIAGWVKKDLSATYGAKPHTIEVIDRLPPSAVVQADAMHIENVIRNLVENSLKYSDDGVAIVVTLEQKEKTVSVSVKDNGWGVARKYRRKIFSPFYQVPGNGRHRNGYGIGLAQSRNIIREHGGNIKATSAENQGSIFTFSLPLK